MTRPVWMILFGFLMVLVGGIVVPYLMLPGVGIIPLAKLPAALAWILPIFSYGLSVAGLFLGIIGSALYVRLRKTTQHPSLHEKHIDPDLHS